ncbi:Polyamine-transporting ATPase [Thalassoporum mexicanum PCC 7367]|uniref:ABC transporter ATP-binding protein n=1 Tax=Thalassoporum mexicanum TaxID=3457544 RepID=UPI00029FED94|nr:ABC transporter ATP-binding protein [Pseudanabaena sp. PCC 7367]AFY69542.1 Polyamine-transporting ATPase [Pseudanabaena sp. PCC 7367]
MATASKPKPLIELKQISKSFGASNLVLDGVDLEFYPGEAVAIIGPSGTGKSTILRIVSGLLEPDRGEVLINGKPLRGIAGEGGDIQVGMVFQQAALFDSLTVAENVGFSLLEHSHLPRKEVAEIVADKLRLVGMPNVSDRYPSELSGGMRKRVSFARAIVEEPDSKQKQKKILLYDEPTAGLDPVASTVIEDLIRSLRASQCDSYIIVSHQHSTIRRTADRIVMLHGGKVKWQGSVDEIDTTDNPYVRQFFSGSKDGPIQIVVEENS